MKRLLLFLMFLTSSTAFAVGIVPPLIRMDQTPDPTVTTTGDDDPVKTIERITQNARTVGERLQNEDSGSDTQKVQEQLLKDIDSLLKPPPPMSGGGGGGSPPPPMGDSGSSPPPMGGAGGNSGNSPPPKGGGGNTNQDGSNPMSGDTGGGSKRPRGERQQGQGKGEKQEPKNGNGVEKNEPQVGGMSDSKQPMSNGDTGMNEANGGIGGTNNTGKPKPELPLDDPFTRRVWGHLPEKIRQQAMQSYREQFMPRYSEMLKQYYSTLNDKQSPSPSK